MPDDFIEKFILLLQKYPKALKAGFSICIDDLPDHYKLKEKVIEWESVFWKEEIEPNIFKALIDTTFAVYKPYFIGEPIDPDCFCIRFLSLNSATSIHADISPSTLAYRAIDGGLFLH